MVLPIIEAHGGRTIDLAGDGVLAEFGSAVRAVGRQPAMPLLATPLSKLEREQQCYAAPAKGSWTILLLRSQGRGVGMTVAPLSE